MKTDVQTCDGCRSLKSKMATLMNENLHLRAELGAIRDTMAMHRDESGRQLRERCFTERARGLDENTKLLNLHVATQRLHEGWARQDVLLAIQDIVINLIGSEEIAIFELSSETKSLELASSFGADVDGYATKMLDEGIIGAVAASGEAYLRGVTPSDRAPSGAEAERRLTACVPLRLCGRVIGVLAVFRLLAQKPRLLDMDRELLELVSTQAGPALFSSQWASSPHCAAVG